MLRHPKWDERMFFPKWNQPLIDRLLEQQQELKRKGLTREVLILMDDVVLTGKDEDQLAHMCLRGRHFNVSVMCCAVSYTNVCKRARRALDFLLVYSCPMQGDRKILSWEYASNSGTADFALSRLDENQCVVFETSRKQQKLYNWRAQLLEPWQFKRPSLPVLSESQISASRGRFLERRRVCRRTSRTFSSGRTRSAGRSEACDGTPEHPDEETPKSGDAGPSAAPALTESKHNESEDESTGAGR